MISLRLLVLIPGILLTRGARPFVLIILCSLPRAGFGCSRLDVKFVVAVGDVFGGLAAGPGGGVGFIVGGAEGGSGKGSAEGRKDASEAGEGGRHW